MRKGMKHYLSVFARGAAMGAADVIPGVSGGTIAFITGVYHELIDSLRSCDHHALRVLWLRGPKAAWQHINGAFLLSLFGGILLSIFSLAKLVTWCLERQPILVWSFFFGLIAAASVHLLRQIPYWNPARTLLLLFGMGIALMVSEMRPAQLPDTWWMLTLAGAIAICAMILPGISGGFLLLMMGMYARVVEAVSQFQLLLLVPFALGCGLGLLLFSHVLSWLLRRFAAATMALLTGILVGSLKIIWPWKVTVETTLNRHGEVVPLRQEAVLPAQYSELVSQPSQLVMALIVCLLGMALVLALEFWAKRGDR